MLTALADIDYAVDWPADRTLLTLDQFGKRSDRKRLAQRFYLNEAEDAFGFVVAETAKYLTTVVCYRRGS